MLKYMSETFDKESCEFITFESSKELFVCNENSDYIEAYGCGNLDEMAIKNQMNYLSQ